MDHREQMRKEAEQWQTTSVKIIQRVRYGIAAVALLGLLIIFMQNLGFPKQIQETVSVSVITADGQRMEASLTIRGEITNYPFKPQKTSMSDQITVFETESNKQILQLSPSFDYYFGSRNGSVCLLNYQKDQLLLETDLQNIFPDKESQRCLIYTDLDSFDLPGEYAEYFTMLQK